MLAPEATGTDTLANGGVRVSFGCGTEIVDREQTAVDMVVLTDRMPQHHHHHHRLRHKRTA